jgi:hypothetical protein
MQESVHVQYNVAAIYTKQNSDARRANKTRVVVIDSASKANQVLVISVWLTPDA